MDTKRCSACGQDLPLEMFSTRQSRCKPCRSTARRAARREAPRNGRSKSAKPDGKQTKRFHKAREQVRLWTKELDEIEGFLRHEEPKEREEIIDRSGKFAEHCPEWYQLDWRTQEKSVRRGELIKQIKAKYALFGDLRSQKEKAEGRPFDPRAETEKSSPWDPLLTVWLAEWRHERMLQLRHESSEARTERYEQLRFFRLRDIALDSEEQKFREDHLRSRAHREGLRAASHKEGSAAKNAYRSAYNRVVEEGFEDPTWHPLYAPTPEDAARVDDELARYRANEIQEIEDYFSNRSTPCQSLQRGANQDHQAH